MSEMTKPQEDASVGTRFRATMFVLAERERELLALKGPCSFKDCRLHYAHSGPCDTTEAVKVSQRIEIGYVCRQGHFQFKDDPDGDSCGTKKVATIYVKADPEIGRADLDELVGYALESHHRKMTEWREFE